MTDRLLWVLMASTAVLAINVVAIAWGWYGLMGGFVH
jgi:hypothetical protein